MRKWRVVIVVAGIIIVILFGIRFVLGRNEDDWICSNGAWVKHGNPVAPMPTGSCGEIKVTSQSWNNNSFIPKKFTCDGENTSPPITISGLPAGTKSWKVVMIDQDAPGGTFTHWVVRDINPGVTEIAEGKIPEGATTDKNSFGKTGYGGPCPPSGRHHYQIKIYALSGENKILGTGELVGLYR